MNLDEAFEKRLAQVPQRPVPAAWRDDILSAARAEAVTRPVPAPAHASLRDALMALLWPHPTAWAGLAAAWVLILVLTLAGRDPAQPEFARRSGAPSPELRALLRQQEQVLAELTASPDNIRTVPARPAATQPRSQRREERLNA